jgi:hypothetical protein
VQAARELQVHRSKWQHLADFEGSRASWMTGACSALRPEEIASKVRPSTVGCGCAEKRAANLLCLILVSVHHCACESVSEYCEERSQQLVYLRLHFFACLVTRCRRQ